jgi:hypothetical protein
MSSYEVNGKKLPSVTTIIGDCSPKDWGPPWGANMAVEWIRQNCQRLEPGQYMVGDGDLEEARKNFRDVQKEALDVGSETHKAIELFTKILIQTGKPLNDYELHDEIVNDMSPQAANSFGAFLEWADENEFKPIESELTIYGQYWAGTLDCVCYLRRKKTVIDYKTSKNHYLAEHGPQVAAYRSKVDGAEKHGVLRLDKETGEPDYKDYSKRYSRDLAIFNAAKNLYFLRHPIIARKAGVPF